MGAASAAAGAGTFAVFSDTESSSGNSVSAGTLNLQAGANDPTNYSFTVSNLAPGGAAQSSTVTLQNTGNLSGTLDVGVAVTDSDGATPESESGTADDISTQIEITLTYGGTSITNDVQTQISDSGDPLLLSELGGNTVTLDSSMTGSESNDLTISYALQDVGNEYQGDMSSVDLTFTLTQN